MTRRPWPVLLAALALAGCGLGPGSPERGAAQLRVTRDFGQRALGPPARKSEIRSSDTVMRFLKSERRVTTRFGGGFVQSIDGLAGNKQAEHDWFFYVNGRESPVGAADVKLRPSDVVQWDYHRWTATMHVPAIVGAFPEPFVHGIDGRRLPTRVECADPSSKGCSDTLAALDRRHIVATSATLGQSTGEKSIRVLVAPWSELRGTVTARVLQEGPSASGVFARFAANGRLTYLDGAGRAARPAPLGTGLLAATQPEGEGFVWLVTGDGEAAVERAARALDPARLRAAFAVAATPSRLVRLPSGGL